MIFNSNEQSDPSTETGDQSMTVLTKDGYKNFVNSLPDPADSEFTQQKQIAYADTEPVQPAKPQMNFIQKVKSMFSGFGIPDNTLPLNQSPKVLAGVDLSHYATDPDHFQKVSRIYKSIPDISTSAAADGQIKHLAPKSGITGQMLIQSAQKHGVDPKLLLAIMQQDSNLGTKGLGAKTKNPGNVGNNDRGNVVRYPDLAAGVDATAKFLAKNKVK